MSLARSATLCPDGVKVTSVQQLQGLAEGEGQPISLADVAVAGGVALLQVTLLGVFWPRLVVTSATVFLRLPRHHVDALHQTPLYPSATGRSAQSPGALHPLGTGLDVALPGVVHAQHLITVAKFWADDQPLLYSSITGRRALSP